MHAPQNGSICMQQKNKITRSSIKAQNHLLCKSTLHLRNDLTVNCSLPLWSTDTHTPLTHSCLHSNNRPALLWSHLRLDPTIQQQRGDVFQYKAHIEPHMSKSYKDDMDKKDQKEGRRLEEQLCVRWTCPPKMKNKVKPPGFEIHYGACQYKGGVVMKSRSKVKSMTLRGCCFFSLSFFLDKPNNSLHYSCFKGRHWCWSPWS